MYGTYIQGFERLAPDTFDPSSMDRDFVVEVVKVLASAASPSTEVQQQVMRTVEQMSTRSDFPLTLGFLLSEPNVASPVVRQRAGLLLKTMISRGIPTESSRSLREYTLAGIADSEACIRNASSSIITTLVLKSPSQPCSDVLSGLLAMLSDRSPQLVAGAFDTLFKIAEDVIEIWRQISVEGASTNDMDEFKPLVADFMTFSDQLLVPRIETHGFAVQKLKLFNLFASNFLFFPGHPLSRHLSTYFDILGKLAATETDKDAVKEICKGLIQIARNHPDLYDASLEAVINFILKASQSLEYSVRLEALQFWPVVATNGDWISGLQPTLPDLLPVLLENMVYSQEDYLAMDETVLTDDNAAVPDRPEEIAPRFHKEKGDEDDADDDEDEDFQSTWGSEWTVRKAAASALDHLATAYRDGILPSILPLIECKLRSENWEVQESALLALGAIGHGCMQGLSPHLPSIMQLLVSISKSSKPLLRSISCWTISRFASWIAFDTHRSTALPSALSVLLSRMMDQNKRVQEAAVSAFVSLEEEAGLYMEEHLGDILRAVCASMSYYQSKNLLILLDAIACLFESLGGEIMSRTDVISMIVPPVVRAFERVNLHSEKQLAVSLFECLTAITACVGPSVGMENLQTIIKRAGAVMEGTVSSFKRITVSGSNEEKPDGDIVACALDLLCSVIDGLADGSLELISQINFAPLVCELILQFDTTSRMALIRNFYSSTTKQCAFALLGDLARCCTVLLPEETLRAIIPVVVEHVALGPMSVSNNSAWAMGEIAMRKSAPFLDPFIKPATTALLTNLKRFEVGTRPIVRQNAAIALGRIGMNSSSRLISSGAFQEMFFAWCTVMKKMRTDREKLTAVKGFTMCVEASPQTGMTQENLRVLHELIASLFPLPETLEPPLRAIVFLYRQLLGEADWNAMWNSFPLEVQYRLNLAFSLGMGVSQPHLSSVAT